MMPIFGRGFLVAADSTGAPQAFGLLQEASASVKFDDELLRGSGQVAVHAGRKGANLTGKAKVATLDLSLARKIYMPQLASANPTATEIPVIAEPFTGATSVTITALKDVLLIHEPSTGTIWKKVAGAPAASGEYSVSGTTVTMHSADVGKSLERSYTKTAASETRSVALTQASMQVANYFQVVIANVTDGKCAMLKLTRCFSKSLDLLDLKDSWSHVNWEWEALADPISGAIGTLTEGTYA